MTMFFSTNNRNTGLRNSSLLNKFIIGLPAFLLLLLSTFSNQVLLGQNGNQIFDNTYVHEINISFYDANFWDSLSTHYQDNNNYINTTNINPSFQTTLFPNPINEHLMVQMNGLLPDSPLQIEINDLMGRTLHSNEYKASTQFYLDFDFKLVPEGCYFITLKNDRIEMTHKVMVLN